MQTASSEVVGGNMALDSAQKLAIEQAYYAAEQIRAGLAQQREDLIGALLTLDRQMTEATEACTELAKLLGQLKQGV